MICDSKFAAKLAVTRECLFGAGTSTETRSSRHCRGGCPAFCKEFCPAIPIYIPAVSRIECTKALRSPYSSYATVRQNHRSSFCILWDLPGWNRQGTRGFRYSAAAGSDCYYADQSQHAGAANVPGLLPFRPSHIRRGRASLSL